MRDHHTPQPPVGASRHRRWRVWYDPGVLYNGSCTVETGWYAKGPRGDIIQARGWDDLLAGIDSIEDALGHEGGDRLAYSIRDSPGPFTVWQRDHRF